MVFHLIHANIFSLFSFLVCCIRRSQSRLQRLGSSHSTELVHDYYCVVMLNITCFLSGYSEINVSTTKQVNLYNACCDSGYYLIFLLCIHLVFYFSFFCYSLNEEVLLLFNNNNYFM